MPSFVDFCNPFLLRMDCHNQSPLRCDWSILLRPQVETRMLPMPDFCPLPVDSLFQETTQPWPFSCVAHVYPFTATFTPVLFIDTNTFGNNASICTWKTVTTTPLDEPTRRVLWWVMDDSHSLLYSGLDLNKITHVKKDYKRYIIN